MGTDLKSPVVQKNFEELYQYAHEHDLRTTLPAASEGSPRDIVLVDTGSVVYICVKTKRGWFKTAALTAI